jgi:hypothetical protein
MLHQGHLGQRRRRATTALPPGIDIEEPQLEPLMPSLIRRRRVTENTLPPPPPLLPPPPPVFVSTPPSPLPLPEALPTPDEQAAEAELQHFNHASRSAPTLQRERRTQPVDEYAQDLAYHGALVHTPVENRNGRFSWRELAANIMYAMGRAGQSGADWKTAIAAGLGGGLGGIVNPKAYEQRQRATETMLVSRRLGATRAEREAELNERAKRAQIGQAESLINYNRTVRPALAADAARRRDQQAVRADLRLHPHPFDTDNPRDVEFLRRAADAGVHVPSDYGRDERAPRIINLLDADGVTMVPHQWDGQDFVPVTVGEQTVVSRRVPRVSVSSGMSEAAERADADRDASRTALIRSRRTAEEQRAQRIAQGGGRTTGSAPRGESEAARGRRAGTAISSLSDLQRRAETAPTASSREALTRQLKRQGALIRSQFGDLVEDDAAGWPSVLRPPQVSAPGGGGGARRTQPTTEADIRAAGARRNMSEEKINEAVRRARERGLLR